MNGSGLLSFLITLIVLFAIGFIFFLAIDRVVKDAFLAKIAKVVIGCLILIAFIIAIAGVLGLGGGVSASPGAIITFAVGVLVLIVVLYLVELFLGWLAANMGIGAPIVDAIRFVITVVALIALILVAGSALIGGGSAGNYFSFRGLERHGAMSGDAEGASVGLVQRLRQVASRGAGAGRPA
jgi:hypothetical protein